VIFTHAISRLPWAGGQQIEPQDGFGCRILVVFEGAGFNFLFSANLTVPVTLSPKIVPVLHNTVNHPEYLKRRHLELANLMPSSPSTFEITSTLKG
jgi:membrane-associated protease RseP (regulator of RpoE activity)